MKRKFKIILAILFLASGQLLATDLQKGWNLFYGGEYEQALAFFEQALAFFEQASSESRREAVIGQSRVLQELGRYDACRRLLQTAIDENPAAQFYHRLGSLALILGTLQEARENFEAALARQPDYHPAIFEHAVVLWHLGERQKARQVFRGYLEWYRTAYSADPEDIHRVARANVYLERTQDANHFFAEAVKKQPQNWTLYIAWGDLFLEKYNAAEAQTIFRDALEQNPSCQPALIGLARSLAREDLDKAIRTMEQALALNPASPAARTALAELFLAGNIIQKSKEHIAAALEKFPDYIPALALDAVVADRERAPLKRKGILDRIAAINPKDASAHVRLGEDSARRYLFRESVDYFEQALAIDPEHWSAMAALGTSLSRLAREQEAKKYLERAFKRDPYNVLSGNLLNLFDDFSEYETIKTEHFLIRMHRDDRPVIGHTAAALCEQAYASMAARYGYRGTEPITVEIFPQHDDFAVRCFGLPGAQVFLGICFGPLVAMDSPRARPKGSFNWQETLWHEIAHVIHLKLTDNRIPRWLAEGIAVYEATRARPEWRMNMELSMIRALQRDDLLPVGDLDRGFTRNPEQVSLVYYQASQIIDFIASRDSFAKVLELLPRFRMGETTEEAISAVFDQTAGEFDRRFRNFLKEKFAPDQIALEWEGAKSRDPAALEQLADSEPDNFYAALHYGRYLFEAQDFQRAADYLQRAKKLLPAYVEKDNPYSLLAQIHWEAGQKQAAIREMEALVARNGKALDAAIQLYEWRMSIHDTAGAARALSLAVAIHPYDMGWQRKLGELWLSLNQPGKAVPALRSLIGLRPSDLAGAHCLLAEALLASGEKADAKKQAILALEIAPSYDRAQEILLKSIE